MFSNISGGAEEYFNNSPEMSLYKTLFRIFGSAGLLNWKLNNQMSDKQYVEHVQPYKCVKLEKAIRQPSWPYQAVDKHGFRFVSALATTAVDGQGGVGWNIFWITFP